MEQTEPWVASLKPGWSLGRSLQLAPSDLDSGPLGVCNRELESQAYKRNNWAPVRPGRQVNKAGLLKEVPTCSAGTICCLLKRKVNTLPASGFVPLPLKSFLNPHEEAHCVGLISQRLREL